MYLQELVNIFTSVIEKTVIKDSTPYADKLRSELKKKKYDTQDISLMEILINEDREEFENNYLENLESSVISRNDLNDYLDSDECIEETVNLYLQSLEHSIDYYYNTIIAKHFTST